MLSPRPSAPVLLALCLAACADDAGGDSRGPQVRETLLLQAGDPSRTQRAQRALWLDGQGWLRVSAEGRGRIQVQVTRDGAQPSLVVDEEIAESATRTVDLPGEGPRAVQLDFQATGDARWTSAVVGQPSVLFTAPASTLPGSLAGRDVLVLVLDSVDAAHTSAYGYRRATTPSLERLATRGVCFETAYSQTAWTLSSVTSLFTSLEQERHGVLRMDQRLADEAVTLAELYRAAGYRTVGLVQNGVIGQQTGLDQGFDVYRSYPWGPQGLNKLLDWARDEITAERDVPLCLYVHLTPPHMPYQPPKRYQKRFADRGYEGEVDGSILSCAEIRNTGFAPDHPDVQHLAALYDEHLSYADAMASELIDTLEAREGPGYVVVASSDHGEAFMQHGTQGHNNHVYEEMVRVPLVITAPGSDLPRGARITAPVSLLDVLPTLAELCGVDAPERRGTSLVGLMEGQEPARVRPIFLSSRYKGDATKLQLGVRIGRHKLVMKAGSSALYDLEVDPGELADVSAELPVLAAALRGELSRWRLAANADRMEAEQITLSSERREALDALGYGGDDEDE